MPAFQLDQPLALALLPLLLAWVFLLPRRRLRALPVVQRRLALALRGAVLTALAVALAGPSLAWPGQSRGVVFLLDTSESLSPAQREWARGWVREAMGRLGPERQADVAVVEFGATPRLAGTAVPADPAAGPPSDRTNLEAALRLAAGLLPGQPAKEVVLLSDGWENEGRAADLAVPESVSVSYVPMDLAGLAPEVALSQVEAPPVARVGDTLDLVATVHSTAPTAAQLRVWLDGRRIVDRPVSLQAGANRVSLAPRAQTTGFNSLRLELAPPAEADTRPDNNALEAVTLVREAGRVLVLESRAGEAAEVAAALSAEGVRAEVRPAASIPPSAAALLQERFDAVVLVNTSATDLALDQQRTLQQYVQEHGRGLLVVGGPLSFALGGYEGTILDEMLPVSSKPPPQPQQGSVALVLVVDKSASMEFTRDRVTKLEMAREAAVEAAGLLNPNDTLGVLAFDTRNEWVVETAKLESVEAIRSAQARIAAIESGGGTSIFPALEAAYQAVVGVDARVKHIVLLTDGKDDVKGYEELIQRMRPHGVTLSAVAVGSDADTQLLATLARLGEGRFYFTERSTQIPRITNKETAIMTRNALVEGQVAALVKDPSPLLRRLAGDFPPLAGYVATTPRERAVTALWSERGHPLLAHWQYGLGRVAAWTSDGAGAWAADWKGWADHARFWAQAVRWTMPAPHQPGLQVSADVESGGRRVLLRAESAQEDGRFADLLDTRATVVAPNGVAREVVLPQRAPGLYERALEVEQPGVYRVLFTQRREPGGSVVGEELAGFAVGAGPELRTVGVNVPLLRQLAQRTGGRELREPRDLLDPQAPFTAAGQERQPLWPWLVGLAATLLPLDVAARRLRWAT